MRILIFGDRGEFGTHLDEQGKNTSHISSNWHGRVFQRIIPESLIHALFLWNSKERNKSDWLQAQVRTVPQQVEARFLAKHYPEAFVGALLVALLLPLAIPTVTENFTWIFVVVITFGAWLIFKWDALSRLKNRSNITEVAIGAGIVAALLAYNYALHKEFGLINMIITVGAVMIAFYGFRSARFFLIPLAYLGILVAGYQIESSLPQLTGLEVWEAGLMANFMNTLGISASVSGNIVTLANSGGFLALEVAAACTGIKGIMAFGTLSSMAVLDIKISAKRLVLVLAVGFVGVFLMDLVRLASIFLTFYYLGIAAGETMHIYLGYSLFIAWVLIYWSISFKYLIPHPVQTTSGMLSTAKIGPSPK